MLECPFRLTIGPYWILLPGSASISAEIRMPTTDSYQIASTHWVVFLGRFRLGIHLDPMNNPDHLTSFIDQVTKGDADTPSISVNAIPGVTHGGYGPPRTWIDWWFKKGDTMICLCLQSKSFPVTEPTQAEVEEHNAIISSIKYCRDFPTELPPLRPPAIIQTC